MDRYAIITGPVDIEFSFNWKKKKKCPTESASEPFFPGMINVEKGRNKNYES